MNGELIKREALIRRIDEQMKALKPYDKNGHWTADFDIHALLYDCRAALSRKYVPMTDDELTETYIQATHDYLDGFAAIQSEVTRRAELDVEK